MTKQYITKYLVPSPMRELQNYHPDEQKLQSDDTKVVTVLRGCTLIVQSIQSKSEKGRIEN